MSLLEMRATVADRWIVVYDPVEDRYCPIPAQNRIPDGYVQVSDIRYSRSRAFDDISALRANRVTYNYMRVL